MSNLHCETEMGSRSIIQIFDTYQKARLSFVQTIAELALRENNVDVLQQAKVLELLQSLLGDVCKQIRQCAALALGRLVHHDVSIAKYVLSHNFMPLLMYDIDRQGKHFKKAALFVIRSLCKHNEEIAAIVISHGGLEPLILCMEDFDPMVKQGAAWAIGYIAKHNQVLAKNVVDAGAIPLLILILQEPELTLKQIAANALSDIAKHSLDLAQNVVDAGAVPHLARSLVSQDEKLKQHVLSALCSIAKHSNALAEVIIEAELFPSVLTHMAHACPIVRKNAASLVRDVVKHSLELTQLVVNTGGIGALMEALRHPSPESKVPCITSIGYTAGHSDQLAMSVLGCNGVLELVNVLNTSTDDATLSVTAWALGQIGKHSPEHAKAVAITDAFPRLLALILNPSSSEDLKHKCKCALKQCLQRCLLLSALEPLIYTSPPNILKYVLAQFSKVLPNDPKTRRLFVTTGGLKRIQEIQAEPGSTLMEYITIINACYPEEIVRYYSPGYPDTLLDAVEQYSPQMMTILREVKGHDSDAQTNIECLLDGTSTTASQQLQVLL